MASRRTTRTKAKADVEPDTVLHTSEHIQAEQNINFALIKVDVDRRFGQIRGVDAQHVRELAQSMIANRPAHITLTVWPDQGIPPGHPPPPA